MLVVKVEIWPGGDRARAQEIARIGVANTSGLRPVSDYSVAAVTPRGRLAAARVLGHRRVLGWIPLIVSALDAIRSPQVDVPQADDIAKLITQEGEPR